MIYNSLGNPSSSKDSQALSRNSHVSKYRIARHFCNTTCRILPTPFPVRHHYRTLSHLWKDKQALPYARISTVLVSIRSQDWSLGSPTFQAFGAMSSTSSRLNIACWYNPCEAYRSDSSAQASASVGDESRNITRALMASTGLPKERRSAIRRFAIGYIQS
jgi:hypothetical protein